MTQYTWPSDLPIASAEWGLQSNNQIFRSPLTGAEQVLELPGARWVVSLSFERDNPDVLAPLQALLVRLRGQAHTFSLHNHERPTPRGIATGTPLVNGASQTGSTLNTDGWTPSTTGILLAGDYIGIGSELKMIVADVDANGSGEAALSIEPPLRASPSDNDPIVVTRPTAIFRLANSTSRWRTSGSRPMPLTSLTLAAEEAF